MFGQTTKSFSDILETVGARVQTLSDSGRASTDQRIVLRELSVDGRFLQLVKCLPGQVTVILNEHEPSLETFRAALLGEDLGVCVDIRCGTRELHSSEIHNVSSAPYLWSNNVVRDILRAAGVPSDFQESLLSQVGLDEVINEDPQDLTPGEMRRLAVICSFFSKSFLLHYDRPFRDVDPKWIGVLAEMILRGAEVCGRTAVVTGVEKIPAIWKTSAIIRLERGDGMLNGDFPPDADVEIRDLVLTGRQAPEQEVIITRPQIIPQKKKSAIPEALQAEAIHNPHLKSIVRQAMGGEALGKRAEIVQLAQSSTEGGPRAVNDTMRSFPSGRMRRSPSGSLRTSPTGSLRLSPSGTLRTTPSGRLTRVSGVTRIKRSPTVNAFTRVVLKLKTAIRVRAQQSTCVVGGAKLQSKRRATELKTMLLVVLLLILAMLLIQA